MYFLFFVFLMMFAGLTFAQSVPPSNPGNLSVPVTSVGNRSTLGSVTLNSSNLGRFSFSHTSVGNLVVDSTTGLPLPDGRTLPVNLRSTIPKTQIASAIGRFAKRTMPPLVIGAALFDLAKELGFRVSNQTGPVEIFKQERRVIGGLTFWASRQHPSMQAACDHYYLGTRNWNHGGLQGTVISTRPIQISSTIFQCILVTRHDTHPFAVNERMDVQQKSIRGTPIYEITESSVPISEFIQSINTKTDFVSNSALSRVTVDAVKAGESIALEPFTVTGPATSPGQTIVTSDRVNNTTTTTTTTNHHTYSGPSITTTTITNTVTINNTTGGTISDTTIITNPVMPERNPDREDEITFQDAVLPEIPVLYTPRFPDGLIGVWNNRRLELLETSLFQIIPSMMPNIADGGCPQWSIPALHGGQWDMSIPCNVWYFIRLIIIITALLLARRLIFGG